MSEVNNPAKRAREENTFYTVWGPDGFPIAPRPATGVYGVLAQVHHLLRQIEHQGYYFDSHQNKLTPADVVDSISIEAYDMEVSTTMAYTIYIQENLDRISRDGWTPLSYPEFIESEECRNLTDADADDLDDGWVLLGQAAVDSGQLLVTDPCNLSDEWVDKEDSGVLVADGYRHKDGTLFYCSLHGSPPSEDAVSFPSFDHVIEGYGKSMNTMREEDDVVEEADRSHQGQYSYAGCCDATLNGHGGQLNYKMGHAGAGVAFSSGFGDGVYDVYGKIRDCDTWG